MSKRVVVLTDWSSHKYREGHHQGAHRASERELDNKKSIGVRMCLINGKIYAYEQPFEVGISLCDQNQSPQVSPSSYFFHISTCLCFSETQSDLLVVNKVIDPQNLGNHLN